MLIKAGGACLSAIFKPSSVDLFIDPEDFFHEFDDVSQYAALSPFVVIKRTKH